MLLKSVQGPAYSKNEGSRQECVSEQRLPCAQCGAKLSKETVDFIAIRCVSGLASLNSFRGHFQSAALQWEIVEVCNGRQSEVGP